MLVSVRRSWSPIEGCRSFAWSVSDHPATSSDWRPRGSSVDPVESIVLLLPTDHEWSIQAGHCPTSFRNCVRSSGSRLLRFERLAVSRTAGALAVRHSLSGADAVHLASAVAIASIDPVMAVWDVRLHAAAGALGLKVAPLDCTT